MKKLIKRSGRIIAGFASSYLWQYEDPKGVKPEIHILRIQTKSGDPSVTIYCIPDALINGGGTIAIINEISGTTVQHQYAHSLREFFLQICRAATGDSELDRYCINVWAKK